MNTTTEVINSVKRKSFLGEIQGADRRRKYSWDDHREVIGPFGRGGNAVWAGGGISGPDVKPSGRR